MSAPKQVIIVRKDLKMSRGKISAQSAHASMAVLLNSMSKQVDKDYQSWILRFKNDSPLSVWLNGAFTKVCLSVNSEEELLDIYQQAVDAKLPCAKIVDNGLTVFNGVPTLTCIAIGPADPTDIDPITGHLSLYN